MENILKSKESPIHQELLEKLVNNAHFFDPNINKYYIINPYSSRSSVGMRNLSAAVRSLEFMRPVKDDIDFVEEGKEIEYTFKLYGVTCTLKHDLWAIGKASYDNYIKVGRSDVCVKANGQMTNGDFITTLVLAVKNNATPNILKLVAYNYHKRLGIDESTIHNTDELQYKQDMLRALYKENADTLDVLWNTHIHILDLSEINILLADFFGVPKEILGDW